MPSRKLAVWSHWALPFMVALLTSVGTSGCLDMQGFECTPADTTHSCCVKQHPTSPEDCDGIEETSGATFRSTSATKTGVASGTKAALTAVAALVLEDAEDFEEIRVEIEEILKECARTAEDEVNRKRLGGEKPDKGNCDKEVGRRSNGESVTQAMLWGIEKHDVARECASERLGKLIPGHFSLEQRYRYDLTTRRTSLVSDSARRQLVQQGRGNELVGTLQPDVVIHSGDPLDVLAVYDFKFPCPEDNPPTWSRYPKNHPYQGRTQGEMYERALGQPPARVTPWWGIIRRISW